VSSKPRKDAFPDASRCIAKEIGKESRRRASSNRRRANGDGRQRFPEIGGWWWCRLAVIRSTRRHVTQVYFRSGEGDLWRYHGPRFVQLTAQLSQRGSHTVTPATYGTSAPLGRAFTAPVPGIYESSRARARDPKPIVLQLLTALLPEPSQGLVAFERFDSCHAIGATDCQRSLARLIAD